MSRTLSRKADRPFRLTTSALDQSPRRVVEMGARDRGRPGQGIGAGSRAGYPHLDTLVLVYYIVGSAARVAYFAGEKIAARDDRFAVCEGWVGDRNGSP